jgi:hypothetical protein
LPVPPKQAVHSVEDELCGDARIKPPEDAFFHAAGNDSPQVGGVQALSFNDFLEHALLDEPALLD